MKVADVYGFDREKKKREKKRNIFSTSFDFIY